MIAVLMRAMHDLQAIVTSSNKTLNKYAINMYLRSILRQKIVTIPSFL